MGNISTRFEQNLILISRLTGWHCDKFAPVSKSGDGMIKKKLFAFAVLSSLALGISELAAAQDQNTPEQAVAPGQPETTTTQAAQSNIFKPEGKIITPESSVVRPEDAGIRAHTNHLIFVP